MDHSLWKPNELNCFSESEILILTENLYKILRQFASYTICSLPPDPYVYWSMIRLHCGLCNVHMICSYFVMAANSADNPNTIGCGYGLSLCLLLLYLCSPSSRFNVLFAIRFICCWHSSLELLLNNYITFFFLLQVTPIFLSSRVAKVNSAYELNSKGVQEFHGAEHFFCQSLSQPLSLFRFEPLLRWLRWPMPDVSYSFWKQ